MLSYAHGACDEPLLGETIGRNLERTIRAFPMRRPWSQRTRGSASPTESSAPLSNASRGAC